MELRDGTCRFPGCSVPAVRSDTHHIIHWADGGPTILPNILALCEFHHQRLHEGAFRIVVDDAGGTDHDADGWGIR